MLLWNYNLENNLTQEKLGPSLIKGTDELMPMVDLSVFFPFFIAPQPWGTGELPYISYMGMCGSEGYGFQAVK